MFVAQESAGESLAVARQVELASDGFAVVHAEALVGVGVRPPLLLKLRMLRASAVDPAHVVGPVATGTPD
jgi:hypothetical protein